MAKYAIILAAGNQTRFKSNVPKGLFGLRENIAAYKGIADKIYLICSYENQEFFNDFKTNDFEIVPIKSGYGCGEAALTSLNGLPIDRTDTVFLSWGDSIQTREVVKFCDENFDGTFLMPVVMEEDPYVKIETDGELVKKILFSKHGDDTSGFGYHDMSLFVFRKFEVENALNELMKKTEFSYFSGKELVFLEIFNYNLLYAKILEVTFEKARSFNTLEECQEALTI